MQKDIFEFTGNAKKNLLIAAGVGVVLIILGALTFKPAEGSGHGEDGHGDSHASVETTDQKIGQMVAYQEDEHQEGDGHAEEEDHGDSEEGDHHDDDQTDAAHAEPGDGHHEEAEHHGDDHAGAGHSEGHGGGHHEEVTWLKRFAIDLWINHIYFFGIGVIGVFFFAIQYAANVGWSSQLKRVFLNFGNWLPISFILGLVLFFVFGHDIFHWTHSDLYVEGGSGYDKIIDGKAGFFFWPLEKGGPVPFFFLLRYLLFFGAWILIMRKFYALSRKEDEIGGDATYFKIRSWSAIFLVIFAVSSSTSAWDWILSIDTHWFSTMFGWYVFASWFVSGLAAITFLVIALKKAGYLPNVTSEHLHDLGKFMFAFSIFWTYVWFSQFLLIYYANIPEETIYFVERLRSDHFSGYFFINIILNFFLPFLMLMTRDSKRHLMFLQIVAVLIMGGHWIDFFLMMTPGTVGESGNIGFTEMGTILVFGSAFLFVVLNSLKKLPLVPKNDPMLVESLHHHT
ncbi:MAG TPA: quinol:cytochrome C oxidoreductase [Cytophagales bacterium]|nr:quinol:cytochrome C oxidoreductase [Cytophagales bacterium]HAA17873.1 quinol:cytochrome C oxidoreductase [Cytophagales bacterium]